ncbi:helix-turn-helix domain-containing protein [Streptomyces sp. NPDC051976]|uniref:helix-turn-helix domain-containing protein n=1 Tax=Streptomyces sp. NPDC051976 TaxID=3154947 RepID=UPI003431D31D
MAHDAFAHRGLGSSSLLILSALSTNPVQRVGELVAASAVSRATTYRTLKRLAAVGLVVPTGAAWSLAPGALEGIADDTSLPRAAVATSAEPLLEWQTIAVLCGTTGIGERRRLRHAAERATYRAALEQRASHRSRALVVIHDGRQVVVPSVHPDELPAAWRGPGGVVVDPSTGRFVPGWRVATDGRLIHLGPGDERSYDELAAAHAQAVLAWESAA